MEERKETHSAESSFNGFQGFSTVDYIIVSQNLYKSFDSFIVKQPSPLSDHSQLIGWLNISRPVKIACLNNTELHSLQLQIFVEGKIRILNSAMLLILRKWAIW